MPDRISISELHGYLIDERNSGSLTEIPATLYEEVHAELNALTSEARSMGDPFGEGVQILLKERERDPQNLFTGPRQSNRGRD